MIQLYIVDDHNLILEGLSTLLAGRDDLNIIGTFSDPHFALGKLHKQDVDIILSDINMPQMSGFEFVRKARKTKADIKFILISMLDNIKSIDEAMQLNIEGYVLKNVGKEELIQAIHTVYSGGSYYAQTIKDRHFQAKLKPSTALPKLSERELQILELISKEHTTKDIAAEIGLSPNTVEVHRKNLFAKMGVKNVAGLIRKAFENGILK